MGAFPQFTFIYEDIKSKLDQRGGNNLPMSAGGVSGLTPWIRLISGAGKGLVLQSVYNKDGFTARYGNYQYDNVPQKSGIVGYELDMKTPVTVEGRPLRPSPIVSSISVDEGDIGKRKTSFNIVAYTLEHMEKLAEHFLEPGFYVLLEWGWNTNTARAQWVGRDNGGVITPCAIARHHRWQTISSKRRESKHDYDATLGLITGGGIEFGDNETYILKIELTSIGEVAEYMQTHKDASSPSNPKQKSGKIFNTREINEITKSSNNPAGRGLFAQMVNGLPAQKQTTIVKNFKNNQLFVDQSSYVNMDEVILESLQENWRKGAGITSTSNEKLKIPSDEPIISSERFIRFELAAEILQSYSADLAKERDPISKIGCPDNQQPLKININDCICSAFPHMFSTDKTKLYIPNIKAPEFGFNDAFSGEEAKKGIIFDENGKITKTSNLHPKTVYSQYTGTRAKNGQYNSKKVPHAFPSNYRLTNDDNPINKTDSTFVPYVCPKGWWGWLKNLYINYDFFTEVLQTPNYTVRDILYDLLNGMSGAVNSLWKFQIVETNVNDHTELKVVDLNFTGDINSVAASPEIKTFQSRGTTSPFVNASFTVDVPGSTMNSTIQKRLSNDANSDPNADVNPKPILGQVFRGKEENFEDKVGTIISNIKFKDVQEEGDSGATAEAPKPPTEDEIRLANYEFFMGKAGVFPTIQYRTDRDDIIQGAFDWVSGNDASIEEVMIVGTWNDTLVLQQVLNHDKGKDIELNNNTPNGEKALNAPYGMARFEFTVHGLSGFKRGDVFRVDGLPKNFGKPHFFQVDSLSHSIDSSGWYVTVSAGLRPFGTNDNIEE